MAYIFASFIFRQAGNTGSGRRSSMTVLHQPLRKKNLEPCLGLVDYYIP